VKAAPPAKVAAKKASLFDDDEGEEDDLFSKPAAKPAPAAKKPTLSSPPPEPEEEEEELPAGPVSPNDESKGDVTLPYAVLKAFLVRCEMLTADFDGSPEELAEKVIDETQ
jgi:hypothetical protein